MHVPKIEMLTWTTRTPSPNYAVNISLCPAVALMSGCPSRYSRQIAAPRQDITDGDIQPQSVWQHSA